MIKKKCKGVTKSGKPCTMPVMKSSDYCYIHNPKISKKEKLKNWQKGGKSKRALIPLEFKRNDIIKLDTVTDVKSFLTGIINSVFKNQMDLKTATGLNYLLLTVIKIIEVQELETRVKKLEEKSETAEDNILNFTGWDK